MVHVMSKEETSMEILQRREQALARHERLVAYVHALSDTHEVRTGVWMEHSYARARGSPPADSAPRVLLGARALTATEEPLDVERLDPPPLSPPVSLSPSPLPSDASDIDSDGGEEGWESRVAALAPTATNARLVGRAVEVLRAQRLARLAAKGCSTSRREAARTAARRLRSALAAQWAGPARAPHWLHATLSAHLPRRLRSQYDEAITELVRAAPRLAERVGVARVCRPASPVRECDVTGPWLAWVEEGRWERRLAALVPTRVLRLPESATGPPEAWCAALAGAMRVELAEVVAEAGDRGVVVGGAGAGAALAAWLCSGAGGAVARVRGLVLVAPALETAEGARDSPEDPLREVRLRTLLVCGGGGGSRARAVCARGLRRLVEVRGTDGGLRMWRGWRRRGRVTQEALDAAVAEEVARWVQELAEGDSFLDGHQKIVHSSNTHGVVGLTGVGDREEEELSQVTGVASSHTTRSLEIAEGRVVARVSGGTPLALAPPRRSACSPPSGSPSGTGDSTRLAPVDIMQMPIVFADDAGARARARAHARARARAGQPHESVPYSRVIVAKRGAGPGSGAGAAAGAGGGALVVRRASRRDR